MKMYICRTCGGALEQRQDGSFECTYCRNVYLDKEAKANAEMLKELLDEFKLDTVSNLRRNLYDAINEKYVDSEKIIAICRKLKEYLPDDFMANFYETVNQNDLAKTVALINGINADAYSEYIEGILKFIIKSFTPVFHLPLVNLIERSYSKTDKAKFEKYHTMIQEEAEKESLGVYRVSITRDVFVAYASADMDKVTELVSYLEASGLKCFVAARNLRHGKGAAQNYKNAIAEAIRNCKSVVFVSSQSSRNFSCDALNFELPLIKQSDIDNSPAEFRQDYASIPYIYKKPRVEYRLEESLFHNAADEHVEEFFDGLEYAYTPKEVGSRIIAELNALAHRKEMSEESTANEKQVIKESNDVPIIGTNSLLKRAVLFLEDGDVKSADEYCERALDIDPENSTAYLIKLMIDIGVNNKDEINKAENTFEKNPNYKKIIRFGDSELKNYLAVCLKQISEKISQNKYLDARNLLSSDIVSDVEKAIEIFQSLGDYKDAKDKIFECTEKINQIKEAEKKKKRKRLKIKITAISLVILILVGSLLSVALIALHKSESIYNNAIALMNEGSFEAAITEFESIYEYVNEYKDTERLIKECEAIIKGSYRNFIDGYDIAEYVVHGSVKAIKQYAFQNTVSLQSVIIPNGVASIDSYAFSKCRNLVSVDLPESLETIGSCAFWYCTSLTQITIPRNVTYIASSAFLGCESLTSIVLPNSTVQIKESTFLECKSLKSITIPHSVTSIGTNAFKFCTSLTEITFTGTRSEWEAIEKAGTWNYGCPEITVRCTDGSITVQ